MWPESPSVKSSPALSPLKCIALFIRGSGDSQRMTPAWWGRYVRMMYCQASPMHDVYPLPLLGIPVTIMCQQTKRVAGDEVTNGDLFCRYADTSAISSLVLHSRSLSDIWLLCPVSDGLVALLGKYSGTVLVIPNLALLELLRRRHTGLRRLRPPTASPRRSLTQSPFSRPWTTGTCQFPSWTTSWMRALKAPRIQSAKTVDKVLARCRRY